VSEVENTSDMPRLTPAIVADDEALAELVDLLYESDAHLNARNTEIAIAQGDLAKVIPREAWDLYRAVESLTLLHERLLIRWAFEQGRKYPLVPSPGGAP
jgi:hypothetical protein